MKALSSALAVAVEGICLGGGSWTLRSSRATPNLCRDDRWSDIKSITAEPFQIIKYQYLHFNYPLLALPGQSHSLCVRVWLSVWALQSPRRPSFLDSIQRQETCWRDNLQFKWIIFSELYIAAIQPITTNTLFFLSLLISSSFFLVLYLCIISFLPSIKCSRKVDWPLFKCKQMHVCKNLFGGLIVFTHSWAAYKWCLPVREKHKSMCETAGHLYLY